MHTPYFLCTHTYVYAESKIFVGVSYFGKWIRQFVTHSYMYAGSKMCAGVNYVGEHIVDLADVSVRDALMMTARLLRILGVCAYVGEMERERKRARVCVRVRVSS